MATRVTHGLTYISKAAYIAGGGVCESSLVLEPEILVTISMRLPQADRVALAAHLQAVIRDAIIAGGDTVHVALQPYDPNEEGG